MQAFGSRNNPEEDHLGSGISGLKEEKTPINLQNIPGFSFER